MRQNHTRIALKDSVTSDKIEALAEGEKWHFQDEVLTNRDDPFDILIWMDRDSISIIHYIVDYAINLHYIIITGPEPQALENRIRSNLDTYNIEEVLGLIEKAHDKDLIDSLYLLAIAASNKCNPRIFNIFKKAFEDSEPNIRKAAIVAVGYIRWPEFYPILRRTIASDSDLSVRQSAALMLDALNKYYN
jgi:hypothetical protein